VHLQALLDQLVSVTLAGRVGDFLGRRHYNAQMVDGDVVRNPVQPGPDVADVRAGPQCLPRLE
jgi:hypothetical protein